MWTHPPMSMWIMSLTDIITSWNQICKCKYVVIRQEAVKLRETLPICHLRMTDCCTLGYSCQHPPAADARNWTASNASIHAWAGSKLCSVIHPQDATVSNLSEWKVKQVGLYSWAHALTASLRCKGPSPGSTDCSSIVFWAFDKKRQIDTNSSSSFGSLLTDSWFCIRSVLPQSSAFQPLSGCTSPLVKLSPEPAMWISTSEAQTG